MKNPQGYATMTVDGIVVAEQDTFTCGHCNGVVAVLPGQVDTDSCRACDSHICPACAGELARSLSCVPFEKRMDVAERRDAMRRLGGGVT
jgi:hypothetical protein